MFPSALPWEILRFSGNKIHRFPQDQVIKPFIIIFYCGQFLFFNDALKGQPALLIINLADILGDTIIEGFSELKL